MDDPYYVSNLLGTLRTRAHNSYVDICNHSKFSTEIRTIMYPDLERFKSLTSLADSSKTVSDIEHVKEEFKIFLKNLVEVARTGELPNVNPLQRLHNPQSSHKKIESPKDQGSLDGAFDEKMHELIKMIDKI